MRIHIVQKGDTLWEIAKQYDADFEQVKQLNPQLSSPDMIMPGMKIKIPASSKPVKKEGMHQKDVQKEVQKETQKPQATTPYKDTSPKPVPMKEDDYKQPKEVTPKMPMHSDMTSVEQEMNQYYTTINLPQVPTYQQPAKQSPQHGKDMWHPSLPNPDLAFSQHSPCPPGQMPQVSPYSSGQKDCGCGGGPVPMQMPAYQQPMHHQQMPMYQQPVQMPAYQQPMHHQQMPMYQQPMPHYQMQQPMDHKQGQMPQSAYYGDMTQPYKQMPANTMQHGGNHHDGSYGPAYSPASQQGYHDPQMRPAAQPDLSNHQQPMPQPPGFQAIDRGDGEQS